MIKKVGYTETGRFTCLEDLDNVSDCPMLQAISLDYAGKEQCLHGHQFGPYIREKYVIHFVLEGKGTFVSGGQSYHLEKGDAFLIYPNEETVYRADEEEPWNYAWVGFHGYRTDGFVVKMGFTREKPVIRVANLDKICKYVDKILEDRQLTAVNELRRMSSLFEIIALVIENQLQNGKSRGHDYPQATYVRYAVDYMTAHYHEKIKIDELAEMIGISRSHLTLSFKKVMNTSPQEFLLKLRMEKACELLNNTSEPINIIGDQVGYQDSLAFSKAFKQKIGLSPKAYREKKVELVKKSAKGDYTGNCPL